MATKEQEEALKKLLRDYIDMEKIVKRLSECETNEAIAYVVRDLYIAGCFLSDADAKMTKNIQILTPFTPNVKQWKINSVRYHINKVIDADAKKLHEMVEIKRLGIKINDDEEGSYYVMVKMDKSGSTKEMGAKAEDRISKGQYKVLKLCDPLAIITGIDVPEKSTSAPRCTYTGSPRYGHGRHLNYPKLPIPKPPFFLEQVRTLAGLKKARQGATGLVCINVKDLPAHVRPNVELLIRKEKPLVIHGKVESLRKGLPVKVRVISPKGLKG